VALQVASCALRLFNELLTRYQPLPEHFGADRALLPADSMTQHSSFLHDTSMRSSVSSPRSGKPPGYSLLLYIYNEGNFFKTVRKRWTSAAQILDAKSQLCLKKTYRKWLFAFFCAIVFF